MSKCIAWGCTSGYQSNREKLHFFHVPKDKEIIKLWQEALKRDCISPKQPVCEKHFLPHEILRQREILGANGTVLGISPYKIPRLKKGVIPSQFPWTENTLFAEPNRSTDKNMCINDDIFESKLSNGCNDANESVGINFADILKLDSVSLPQSWYNHNAIYNNINTVAFFTTSFTKIDDEISVCTIKEIIVQEDMSIQINVLGKRIDNSTFDLSNKINEIDELHHLICIVNELNICDGNTLNDELKKISSEISYIDRSGINRHKNCPLLLFNGSECEFCKSIPWILNKKLLRIKDREGKVKRIHRNLSSKEQLLKLRLKCRTMSRSKKRARSTVMKIKQEFTDKQNSMATVNQRKRKLSKCVKT